MKKYKRTYNRTKKNNTVSTLQGYIVLVVLLLIPIIVAYVYFGNETKEKAIKIPKGCGSFATRHWDARYNDFAQGSKQEKVDRLWEKKGITDKRGFQKLYGRYLIACTKVFGRVGDKIDFEMTDGTVLKCIIYDIKSQKKTFYDKNPANKWGHHNGKVVLEFVGTNQLASNPYKNLGLKNERTVKAIRHDNIFD